MTRNALFGLLLLALLALPAAAQQKIAYVDIAQIMKELPEAQEAQSQLDNQVEKWQTELRELEDEWQAKFNDYDKRKLILTDQGRARAEKDLQELDRRIMDFRDGKFGQNGELFQMEDRIMRPIQDMVFDQVKNLATELDYDYVFDKSGGVMIIYAKDDYDLTAKAIERIKTLLPARQAPGGGGNQGTQTTQQGRNPRGTYTPPPSDPQNPPSDPRARPPADRQTTPQQPK